MRGPHGPPFQFQGGFTMLHRLLRFFHRATEINIDFVLAQRRQIAVLWSIEDVQTVCPHLRDWQAWDVLEECRINHDREIGINWMLIEVIADALFPRHPKTDDE